ncbi:DNA polymerase IV [Larsenimonas rhizosphaerae]|uniref:DNA polymerase IV n=1 Tax=Larsenimonas rhizosphaerae TaxID=2944682 RepID=A0AA41ZLM9_9GAMM|nr:DNA polymerase IV [Larsenimonas rhizosphaerae]MCX2524396.1 DNA polymerase IV [Larsenimonas rhizosphaerae]
MKKILHADCDCFYAAVEMRDNPALADRPIAVGGRADHRGVIATCNYPARAFGVRSAMPSAQALKLCPELEIIRPDFERYRAVSADIQALFFELTPKVEPLSLDEAYLDVSDVTRFQGSATWMARWLKEQALSRTGITLSVGAAPNKFLAKIASDWDKPDGLRVITPDEADAFIDQLTVNKLHGVGPATAAKLERLGIRTCPELRDVSLARLLENFGKFGQRLYELSRGIDHREVNITRERKSVSVETTFDQDLPDLPACQQAVTALVVKLDERLARHEHPPLNKLFVKVRFNDFSITTLETSGVTPGLEIYQHLLDEAWHRRARPVRLLGVGVRLTPPDDLKQLGLF